MVMKVIWSKFVFIIILPILLTCVGEVLADRVVLENGDILTGTIEKALEGKLTLKTEYSSPIEIQMIKIREIITDNPVEIHLKDGEILKGKIRTLEDGRLLIEKSEERDTTTVNRERVVLMNPPKPKRWSGNLNVGGNLQTGNTDLAGASIAAEVRHKTEKSRLKLRYLFNYAEEDDDMTSRNHYGEARYDYFFTEKLFGFLDVELLNDRFKDFRLRTIVSSGAGYQVWDDAKKILFFEAGPSYVNEDRYEGEDDGYLAARLGGEFRYKIFKFLNFSDQLSFYPSIGEGGKYILRNEAALTAPFGPRWALKFSNILERNSDPPPGIEKDDSYWILSLQYSF